MPNFQQYLRQVKSEIRETNVEELKAKRPEVLIDVREVDEYNEGYIPGAVWIPRGRLELRVEDDVPNRDADVVLYGAGGTRSALAAKSLRELGYSQVRSLQGGFGAWKKAGLAIEKPFIFTQEQKSRYARHLMLPEVGEKGQAKLLQSRVLLLGAGGLGRPAAVYLATAGGGPLPARHERRVGPPHS